VDTPRFLTLTPGTGCSPKTEDGHRAWNRKAEESILGGAAQLLRREIEPWVGRWRRAVGKCTEPSKGRGRSGFVASLILYISFASKSGKDLKGKPSKRGETLGEIRWWSERCLPRRNRRERREWRRTTAGGNGQLERSPSRRVEVFGER